MIKSMTGYGRAEGQNPLGKLVVEVSATNRRYLEVFVGLPQELNYLDKALRDLISKSVKRGRIQLHIDFQPTSDKVEFLVDLDLAKNYAEALQVLCDELELKDEIMLRDILANKDILSLQKMPSKSDDMQRFIMEISAQALQEFIKMREREGNVLREDIIK